MATRDTVNARRSAPRGPTALLNREPFGSRFPDGCRDILGNETAFRLRVKQAARRRPT